MTTRIGRHLRANVVGYLALFVALGGSAAYAADKIGGGEIARDAIRAKHLKPGAVGSAAVANDSLGGADVKESALDPAVLQARIKSSCPTGQAVQGVSPAGAVSCTGAGVPAAEAYHAVLPNPGHDVCNLGETAVFCGANGFVWLNVDNGFTGARFYKDASGLVHLEGAVRNNGTGPTIFILPPGYRPAGGTLVFTVDCRSSANAAIDTAGRVDVLANGRVEVQQAGGSLCDGNFYSLAGIEFRAA